MSRILAPIGAVIGAVGSLLSIFALPWARYGAIDIPLSRFAGWQIHVLCVLTLHACVAWALLTSAGRGRAPLIVGALASLATAGSAIVLALRYNDGAALFSGVMPAVMARPGPGGPIAVLATVVSVVAVVAARMRTRGDGKSNRAAVPTRPGNLGVE